MAHRQSGEDVAQREGPRDALTARRKIHISGRPATRTPHWGVPFPCCAPDELAVAGPSGESFPGPAGPGYRCPPWARDPFAAGGTAATEPAGGDPLLLGGRYGLASGIARATRGRAVDTVTGHQVVVEEARAYSGEDHNSDDVRHHLRYERRMLLALLDAVHHRGVVMRDLAPENLVLDEHGRCDLVDFEIGRLDGVQRSDSTSGCASPAQWRDEPAHSDDDYARGTTLFYAATGFGALRVAGDGLSDLCGE